jgi:hypothetical protein
MRKLMLGALLLVSLMFVGCKKSKTYELTFTAMHNVTEENQFCNPYGYYWWSIQDKDYKSKFDKSDFVIRQTVTGTTSAKSGDYVVININVNDVFDFGSVSCTSSDGSVSLYAYTDNLYISDMDDATLKSVHAKTREGNDTTIVVKQIKFKLK